MNFTSDRQRRAVFSRLAGLSGDRQSSCGILSNRFSEQETDEDKKYIEILKKGGVVYITPPDSPEEFRKYEAEMRQKLERKKFAKDVKKQTILSPVYGKDELEARLPVDNEVIDPKSKQTHFGEEFKEGRRIDTGKLDEAKSVLNDWEYDVKDYDQSVLDEAKASLVSGDILKAKKAIDDQIIIHEAFPEDERTDRLRETSRKLGDIIGSDKSRRERKKGMPVYSDKSKYVDSKGRTKDDIIDDIHDMQNLYFGDNILSYEDMKAMSMDKLLAFERDANEATGKRRVRL